MTKVKIVLVDDHAMFRAGIKALLHLHSDFEVVGETDSGQHALQIIKDTMPDIVVMDISMPGMDGLTTTRLLKEHDPNLHIILLTQHENKEYILPALKMGASGYVLKRGAADDLVTAIRSVNAGKTYLDAYVADIVVQEYRHKNAATEGEYESMTDREKEIFLYLAKGLTNREIAGILYISQKTVDYHRTNIMRKLNIHNRVELTKYAMRKGII